MQIIDNHSCHYTSVCNVTLFNWLYVSIADIVIAKAFFVNMLTISRSLCQKNLQRTTTHFLICSVRDRHNIWSYKRFFVQNKIDYRKIQCLKLQKCDFRTTQILHLPPIVALFLRPVLRVGALLVGRSIKKRWARKSEKEKEEYKQWFRERFNIFLGKFFRNC